MNPLDKYEFIPKIKNPKEDSRYDEWPINDEEYRDLPKTKGKTTVNLDDWKRNNDI